MCDTPLSDWFRSVVMSYRTIERSSSGQNRHKSLSKLWVAIGILTSGQAFVMTTVPVPRFRFRFIFLYQMPGNNWTYYTRSCIHHYFSFTPPPHHHQSDLAQKYLLNRIKMGSDSAVTSSSEFTFATGTSLATPLASNRRSTFTDSRRRRSSPKRDGPQRPDSPNRSDKEILKSKASLLTRGLTSNFIFLKKGSESSRSTSSSGGRQRRPRNNKQRQLQLQLQFELEAGEGVNSLESISSIMSAITLPDSLATVPEADASCKFEMGSSSHCRDTQPRVPRRIAVDD